MRHRIPHLVLVSTWRWICPTDLIGASPQATKSCRHSAGLCLCQRDSGLLVSVSGLTRHYVTVESKELAPVGSSYVLAGRCYLFREENLEVFLIKGNYGIKAESSFETRESGHETERND